MKRFFSIWTLIFLCIGCAKNNRKVNFEYVKIFYSGYGYTSYTFFEPLKDSLIYQIPYKNDTLVHKTMAGKIGNTALLDTFINTIQTLKQYENGSIPLLVDDQSFYCGPTLYTEYKDERGVHFFTYTFDTNDTLDQFITFYENLQHLKWKKTKEKNELIDINGELKSANHNMRLTLNEGAFYKLLSCSNGIDPAKLYGSWRSVRDSFNTKQNSYIKLTIKKNGVCLFKRIVKDTIQESHTGKVTMDNKNNTIVFTENGKEYVYKLIQLCNNCLQYKNENDPKIIRWDRLFESK